ncbi:MAG: type 4a pilus biogenesis protein PilO [Actinomycetota bacterium]|nr:type 4a pilus biogenesis protein PilO [Actinomycetota bacterium]
MKRQTLLIGAAAAAAVLVLWYVLLWSPRQSALSKASERREAAEAKRDELATRVGRLRASQKDEPLKLAQVEALRTTVPDEPQLAAFILDTNDAAAKAGIDFISVAPSEPAPATPATGAAAAGAAPAATAAPGTPPAEIKLQLQVSGGYFQVLDFLNRLNDLPRLVVTDTLTINSDDQAKLTVAVSARMFVRTVPAGYGNVPAATVATPATTVTTAPRAATPPPTATAAGNPTATGAKS